AIRCGPDTKFILRKLIEALKYHPFRNQLFYFIGDACDLPTVDSVRHGLELGNDLDSKGLISISKDQREVGSFAQFKAKDVGVKSQSLI
ncbi:MAG: hypothetical protein ABJQ66_17965, partial [Paracoccaceae bacterium]